MPNFRLISLMVLSIAYSCTALAANAADEQEGIYLGILAGRGTLESTSLQQMGAVRFPHPLPHLPINADGRTDSPSASVGGLQLGYQWAGWRSAESGWGLEPALELEGLYIGKHSLEGEMPIQPRFLGTQYVSADIKEYALLANVVLMFRTPWSERLLPYAGLGAGRVRISLTDADSANPSEPGINHFNSDPDASDSTGALQFKLGVKADVSSRLSAFAEYRHLDMGSTRYTFGPTVYPGEHPPTDSWDVRLGDLDYEFFVAGLQYRF